MANPKGNLAGWSDKSVPGWEKRAIEAVRARQRKLNRTSKRSTSTTVFYDDPLKPYIDEACRRRNISITGYFRRALIAMIAYDLGVDIRTVARYGARPRNYGKNTGQNERIDDDMSGHGPWKITGMVE